MIDICINKMEMFFGSWGRQSVGPEKQTKVNGKWGKHANYA